MSWRKRNCCEPNPHATCGSDVDAKCVMLHDVNPPQWSKHHREKCQSLELLIQELYDSVTEIRESIDVSDLGFRCDSCLDYGISAANELTVGRVLYGLENKVCQ